MLLSGPVCSRFTLRICTILVVSAGLFTLASCRVQSINGLGESGSDKDQTFEPGLLGSWTVANSDDCDVTLKVTADAKEYHWKMTGVGEGCDKDRPNPTYYEAELFQLGNHRFLDVTARPKDVCEMCMSVHWIFLLNTDENSFGLTPIDSEWLENAKRQETVKLATLRDDPDTVTASSRELKEFCRMYADDSTVFKPTPDFEFERKQP